MTSLVSGSDLRQTLRRLMRERGFTATVLRTLALCISANVAIFAVVDAILVEGIEPVPGDPIRAHYTAGVIGDYSAALGLRLFEGRFLADADNHGEQQVCMVDADFVRRYWPGQSALGRRTVNGPVFSEKEAHTIVGVVGAIKHAELGERGALGAVYYPVKTYGLGGASVVVRTLQAPEALGSVLRKLVLALDPRLPVDELKPMQAWIDESLEARRSPAVLAATFAGVALLLAAIGTYGVLAYAVGQRRREIGVRMALGALPGQIRAQFLGFGVRLLLVGLGVGLAGAWVTGRAMQGVLFGVGALHAGVLAGAAALMLLVVLLATFLPAHRAASVSPIEALRDE